MMIHSAIGQLEYSERKKYIRELCDRLAPSRLAWIRRNAYFYGQDES